MSNVPHDNLLAILAHWFTPAVLPTIQVEDVAGGLSRASLWKVKTPQGSFCLRSTPADISPLPAMLKKIHLFMAHTWRAGFRDIPVPHPTLSHETFVQSTGLVWELTTWLTGSITRTPTVEQGKSAAAALARFHLAAASFNQLHGVAPSLQHRLEILDDLRMGMLRDLVAAVDRSFPESRDLARNVISQVKAALPKGIDAVQQSRRNVPVQWCLRDSHIGNFLFVDDDVTGILDFATASIASVSQDIARLIGSMVPHLDNPWQECVEAYRQLRPLSPEEVRLIFAFHVSGTIGAAANWLRWRFIDDLSQADAATTQTRLTDLAARLELLGQAETALSAFHGPIG